MKRWYEFLSDYYIASPSPHTSYSFTFTHLFSRKPKKSQLSQQPRLLCFATRSFFVAGDGVDVVGWLYVDSTKTDSFFPFYYGWLCSKCSALYTIIHPVLFWNSVWFDLSGKMEYARQGIRLRIWTMRFPFSCLTTFLLLTHISSVCNGI